MNSLNKNDFIYSRRLQPELNRHYKWLIFSGITLVILGLSAIVGNIFLFPYVSGSFLILSGVIIVFHAFLFWYGKIMGFVIHFILGVLYCAIGVINFIPIVLVLNILLATIAIIYLIAGLFRIVGAIIEGIAIPGWFVTFLLGIINIIFSLFIWHRWHGFNLYTLINLSGVDIYAMGLALFMLGFNILKVKEEKST